MDVVFRIKSEFFELETSKYRLAITDNVFCQSLRNQSDKTFRIIAEVSAMDPQYSRRFEVFQSVCPRVNQPHECWLTEDRLEVWCDDDIYFHPDFVKTLRMQPLYQDHMRMLIPNGYIWHKGKLSVWHEKYDVVEALQIRNLRGVKWREMLLTNQPMWIAVRHQHNSNLLFGKLPDKFVTGLSWAGWDEAIVDRYCRAKVITATAMGCELHPTKSNSVIYAKGSARNRRKH